MTDHTEIDHVLALEETRIAAMKASDAEVLERLLADELIYTHSRARLDTKASYLAAVRAHAMTYVEITRENVHAARHGDTVVITARFKMRVDAKDGTSLLLDTQCLSVWSRFAGNWQYLAWQATPIVAR